jgi:hypothetical protein
VYVAERAKIGAAGAYNRAYNQDRKTMSTGLAQEIVGYQSVIDNWLLLNNVETCRDKCHIQICLVFSIASLLLLCLLFRRVYNRPRCRYKCRRARSRSCRCDQACAFDVPQPGKLNLLPDPDRKFFCPQLLLGIFADKERYCSTSGHVSRWVSVSRRSELAGRGGDSDRLFTTHRRGYIENHASTSALP